MSRRRIVILGFEDAQSLDISGPLEVFDVAERLSPGRYEHTVISPDGEPFATGSGLRIAPDGALGDIGGSIDTFILAGGTGVAAASRDPTLVASVAAVAAHSRRTASVCTGAFLLAAAGLLDGRRATTHWSAVERLADRHPRVAVDPDSIFVRDGDVWTSAGVTAGIDLALALVEEDHGRETALEIARWLVVFAKRPGGQAQFSAPLAAQLAERPPIRAAQELARTRPEADLTVESLAGHAHMSVRGFARAFRREVGVTPAAYVETVRVERAIELLQTTAAGAEQIATACGFGTVETFRRAFRRRLGVSPGEYRDRFRGAHQGAASQRRSQMQIAIPLFDRFTALDAVGPYQVLSGIPGAEVRFLGPEAGPVKTDNRMLTVLADGRWEDLPNPDVLVVPGGIGTRALLDDERLLDWVRGAHATSTYTTSVCTGALILAAAGLLDGVDATTYWMERELLGELGACPVPERVVERGKVITGAGVSAGIDMALRLTELLTSAEVAQAIQLGIEYDPQPPFDSGAPEKAAPATVELVRAVVAQREAEALGR
jgi:transcriptional regulator GlxA family with amidase domain